MEDMEFDSYLEREVNRIDDDDSDDNFDNNTFNTSNNINQLDEEVSDEVDQSWKAFTESSTRNQNVRIQSYIENNETDQFLNVKPVVNREVHSFQSTSQQCHHLEADVVNLMDEMLDVLSSSLEVASYSTETQLQSSDSYVSPPIDENPSLQLFTNENFEFSSAYAYPHTGDVDPTTAGSSDETIIESDEASSYHKSESHLDVSMVATIDFVNSTSVESKPTIPTFMIDSDLGNIDITDNATSTSTTATIGTIDRNFMNLNRDRRMNKKLRRTEKAQQENQSKACIKIQAKYRSYYQRVEYKRIKLERSMATLVLLQENQRLQEVEIYQMSLNEDESRLVEVFGQDQQQQQLQQQFEKEQQQRELQLVQQREEEQQYSQQLQESLLLLSGNQDDYLNNEILDDDNKVSKEEEYSDNNVVSLDALLDYEDSSNILNSSYLMSTEIQQQFDDNLLCKFPSINTLLLHWKSIPICTSNSVAELLQQSNSNQCKKQHQIKSSHNHANDGDDALIRSFQSWLQWHRDMKIESKQQIQLKATSKPSSSSSSTDVTSSSHKSKLKQPAAITMQNKVKNNNNRMSAADAESFELLGIDVKSVKEIQSLSLCVEDLHSVIFLSHLKNLIKLELNVNKLSSLSGLDQMNNLQELSVKDNLLTSLDALQPLNKLKSLKLDSNKLKNLNAMSAKANLTYLSANHNLLTAFPLLICPDLYHLELHHNHISQINTTLCDSNLSSLLHLDLSGNLISHIDGSMLSKCQLLQTLVLSHNALTTMPAPLYLPNLQKLWLSGNKITSLSNWVPSDLVFNFMELQLSLNPDQLPSFSSSSNTDQRQPWPIFLPKLSALYLQDNLLQNITTGSLTPLISLKIIDISFNKLKSRMGLLGLITINSSSNFLETINMHDNPVYDTSKSILSASVPVPVEVPSVDVAASINTGNNTVTTIDSSTATIPPTSTSSILNNYNNINNSNNNNNNNNNNNDEETKLTSNKLLNWLRLSCHKLTRISTDTFEPAYFDQLYDNISNLTNNQQSPTLSRSEEEYRHMNELLSYSQRPFTALDMVSSQMTFIKNKQSKVSIPGIYNQSNFLLFVNEIFTAMSTKDPNIDRDAVKNYLHMIWGKFLNMDSIETDRMIYYLMDPKFDEKAAAVIKKPGDNSNNDKNSSNNTSSEIDSKDECYIGSKNITSNVSVGSVQRKRQEIQNSSTTSIVADDTRLDTSSQKLSNTTNNNNSNRNTNGIDYASPLTKFEKDIVLCSQRINRLRQFQLGYGNINANEEHLNNLTTSQNTNQDLYTANGDFFDIQGLIQRYQESRYEQKQKDQMNREKRLSNAAIRIQSLFRGFTIRKQHQQQNINAMKQSQYTDNDDLDDEIDQNDDDKGVIDNHLLQSSSPHIFNDKSSGESVHHYVLNSSSDPHINRNITTTAKMTDDDTDNLNDTARSSHSFIEDSSSSMQHLVYGDHIRLRKLSSSHHGNMNISARIGSSDKSNTDHKANVNIDNWVRSPDNSHRHSTGILDSDIHNHNAALFASQSSSSSSSSVVSRPATSQTDTSELTDNSEFIQNILSRQNAQQNQNQYQKQQSEQKTMDTSKVAEEWQINDPKLLATLMKRNKKLKHMQNAKINREKEKDPEFRLKKFMKNAFQGSDSSSASHNNNADNNTSADNKKQSSLKKLTRNLPAWLTMKDANDEKS